MYNSSEMVVTNLIHFLGLIKREVYDADRIPKHRKAEVTKQMQDLAKQGYDLAKNGQITITIEEE